MKQKHIRKSTRAATARDLLAALKGLTEEQLDYEVATEGCDCSGDIGFIVLRDPGAPQILRPTNDGTIELLRTDLSDCNVNTASSRTCEYGTKGCTTKHETQGE